MGKSSELKELRSQLRNVVKELLPEVLTAEVLMKIINERLDKIERDNKAVMQEMNERHKNTMGYLVRQVSTPVKAQE